MRSALSARTVYIAAVVALALATIGGMFALWPKGETPTLKFIEGTPLGETYSGEIFSTTTYECQLYATARCQKVKLEVTSGPDEGKTEAIQVNTGGGLPEFSVGDEVRLVKNEIPPGANVTGAVSEYSIIDFERKPPLLWLTIAFAALVILFGRLRGALSLVGLAISLVIVLIFIVPAILRDSPPLAVALVGSMAVMLTTIPLAHGLGPKSMAAMAGTAVSLGLIVGLAIVFTDMAHLTGVASEEAATLAANNGGINFQSLLIAGMVIGSLGVLDDVTVSQASTVLLRGANPEQRFGELFRRAIDVGRDHVSATVNTLVLAYVGTSLTTLLVFGSGQVGFLDAVNLEVIASVIIATLVGSIGLICAVPITTALAALLAEGIPAEELATDEHLGHTHV